MQIDRHELCRLSFIAAATILGLSLFLFIGNTHEPATYGPSVVSWTVKQWMDPLGKSSHGWFILPISVIIVWRMRRSLVVAADRTDHKALPIIVSALFLYWAGTRAQQPRLGILCFVALSWSIPFYLWGAKLAKRLVFPCSYLIFAMPMGFLDAISFPMRLLSCAISATVLNGLGIATARTGTIIRSEILNSFALNVDDPCSGLQSLIAMTALVAAYAYLTQRTIVKKWILFLLAVPMAIVANAIRIIAIALVALVWGQKIAIGFYHDYSAYVVFAVAIMLMTSLGALLSKDLRATLQTWLPRK